MNINQRSLKFIEILKKMYSETTFLWLIILSLKNWFLWPITFFSKNWYFWLIMSLYNLHLFSNVSIYKAGHSWGGWGGGPSGEGVWRRLMLSCFLRGPAWRPAGCTFIWPPASLGPGAPSCRRWTWHPCLLIIICRCYHDLRNLRRPWRSFRHPAYGCSHRTFWCWHACTHLQALLGIAGHASF